MRKLNKFLIKHNLKNIATLPGAQLNIEDSVISDSIRGYIARGEYEAEEYQLITNSLKSDDVVLEIGAGIGYISCVCASILNDKNRLHVFEANPKIIPIIEENKKLNGIDFVTYNQVLGLEAGTTKFYVPDDYWSASMNFIEGAEAFDLEVLDTNQIIAEIKPTYLIMDIEGAEFDILPKLDLSTINTICLEVHPHKDPENKLHDLFKHLLNAGFMFELNKFDLVYLFKRAV